MDPARARNWIAGRSRWTRLALCLAAGLGLALGHAPYDFPYLWLVAAPLSALLWAEARARGNWPAARVGFWVGLGYFGLTLTWIVEPFLVDIARHGAFALPALMGLAGGLALFWLLGFGAAARLSRRGPVAGVVALASALALAEALRAYVLTGFPWALPAYVWVDTPIAQMAAFVGPHGLGALVLGLAMLPASGLRPGVIGLLGIVTVWGFGAWRLADTSLDESQTVVRLVQPNAEQHLKWRADMMQVFYDRQVQATSAPGAPDVVIWPETAVPFLLGDRPDLLAEISGAAGGGEVILGIRRLDDSGWSNALAQISPGGQVTGTYDKHHLVPFGEYMPLAAQMRAIGLGYLADGLVGAFQPGPGPAIMGGGAIPAYQPLICYEVIFPHEMLRGAERPAWLVQITNDAWFGTFNGPYQHLAQARMRAIEQGLPLARSANTGVSAMIDPLGRVTASIPLGEAGFIDTSLAAPLAPTPYARSGDILVLLALIAVIAGCSIGRKL